MVSADNQHLMALPRPPRPLAHVRTSHFHLQQLHTPHHISQHAAPCDAPLPLACHMRTSLRQQRTARTSFEHCFSSFRHIARPYFVPAQLPSPFYHFRFYTLRFSKDSAPPLRPVQTAATSRYLLYISRLYVLCFHFDLTAHALLLCYNIAKASRIFQHSTTLF